MWAELSTDSYEDLVITTSEALDTLDRMLAEAGFDRAQPDPFVALRVFRAFAEVPVACADDALLFQAGTYSFTGPELFSLYLTRQFTHEEDGEYAGMEQLHCIIYYEPAAELRTLNHNLWSSHCASLADFFAQVEAMPEFQVPTHRHTPLRAEIDQEDV
jgi:hypothetical protein